MDTQHGISILPDRLVHEGLTLRRPEAKDAPLMSLHIRDPRVHQQTGSLSADYTEADAQEFIARIPRLALAGTDHVYAIEDEDGRFCGIAGLNRRQPWLPFELGYWIAPPAWGRKIATRSGAALLTALEHDLGERVCVAAVNLNNLASYRVLVKLGFLSAGRDFRYSRGRNAIMPVRLMARIA